MLGERGIKSEEFPPLGDIIKMERRVGSQEKKFAKRPMIKEFLELRWTGKRPYEFTEYSEQYGKKR